MGLVKTIYNVLGGFYMNYNSTIPLKSVHKLHKSFVNFLCTFTPSNFSISKNHKNMHKKTGFFQSGFVFVYFRKLFMLLPLQYFQTTLQIPL